MPTKYKNHGQAPAPAANATKTLVSRRSQVRDIRLINGGTKKASPATAAIPLMKCPPRMSHHSGSTKKTKRSREASRHQAAEARTAMAESPARNADTRPSSPSKPAYPIFWIRAGRSGGLNNVSGRREHRGATQTPPPRGSCIRCSTHGLLVDLQVGFHRIQSLLLEEFIPPVVYSNAGGRVSRIRKLLGLWGR